MYSALVPVPVPRFFNSSSNRGSSSRSGAGVRVASARNFPVPTINYPDDAYGPQPWTAYTCSPCSSERDCPSPFEFCSYIGCCMPGECETDADCESIDATETYYKVNNFSSVGASINSLHPQDNLYVTRKACDVNSDCVGYDSYGYIKARIQPPALWLPAPPVKDLPPWVLYIKKSATEGNNPQVQLMNGIKNFCARAPATKLPQGANLAMGMCRQCLTCKADSDCPASTVCDETLNCCVSNPCYIAKPELGKWVDGQYTREPQCANCGADEKYCCLADYRNPLSGYCSKQPCSTQQQVRACSYICEDPQGKHDAIMCRANQRCCNDFDGAPVCCSPGSDCNSGNGHALGNGGSNACIKDERAHKCETPGFPPLTCFGSQTCCNANTEKAPSCCAHGCDAASNTNTCMEPLLSSST